MTILEVRTKEDKYWRKLLNGRYHWRDEQKFVYRLIRHRSWVQSTTFTVAGASSNSNVRVQPHFTIQHNGLVTVTSLTMNATTLERMEPTPGHVYASVRDFGER